MAAAPALGAEWVAAHGRGRPEGQHREELKAALLRDIEAHGSMPGVRVADVQVEVDRFLQAGRVSDTNLRRLERRVFHRAGEGALSARGEVCSISDFSTSSSSTWREPPKSARQASQGRKEIDDLLRSLAPTCAPVSMPREKLETVPEATGLQLSRWSEVAKYAKLVEDNEKEVKRELARSQQQQMRKDLELQVQEKRRQKQQAAEEEQQLMRHQQAELTRWKTSQDAEKEKAKSKALQVNRERAQQREMMTQLREEEKQRKREEDRKLAQSAASALDMEVKMLHDRKMEKQQQQQKMVAEMKQERKQQADAKKLQVEEEKQKVKEYHKMLEEQQARNKQNIPPARTTTELPAPSLLQAENDKYSDMNVMKQLKETNQRAEQAEIRKMERLKTDLQSNQDFLFQQIAERDRLKRQVQEQKGSAKTAAQAATAEYLEAERHKIMQQKEKNLQYRLELEQQISAKRAGQQPRQAEDEMSRAERAINRRLLSEAMELKGQLAGREKAGVDGM